jgi:hypothetical protein
MEWWHLAAGLGVVLLVLAVHLWPYWEQMVELRRKRGLAGYDSKQFADLHLQRQKQPTIEDRPEAADSAPNVIPAKAGIHRGGAAR